MLLHEELFALLAVLAEDHVDYALVGGLAVAVWGAPRATKDIDLLVRPGDVPRAKASARRCGFTIEALATEFPDGMHMHRVSKIVDRQLLTLDLLLVNRPLEPHFESRELRQLETTSLWVISRAGLIAMKASAGRPQDEADIVRLTEMDR